MILIGNLFLKIKCTDVQEQLFLKDNTFFMNNCWKGNGNIFFTLLKEVFATTNFALITCFSDFFFKDLHWTPIATQSFINISVTRLFFIISPPLSVIIFAK